MRGVGGEAIPRRREKSSGSASMRAGAGWFLRGEVEITLFGGLGEERSGDFSIGWGGNGRSALSRGRVALNKQI